MVPPAHSAGLQTYDISVLIGKLNDFYRVENSRRRVSLHPVVKTTLCSIRCITALLVERSRRFIPSLDLTRTECICLAIVYDSRKDKESVTSSGPWLPLSQNT